MAAIVAENNQTLKVTPILNLKKQDLQGKKVIVRVDFNVPVVDGEISDDTRIWAALPTLMYLIHKGAKIIVLSHLGRPKGQENNTFSLNPIVERLKTITPFKIYHSSQIIGEETQEKINQLNNGEILVLENIRFSPEEEKNDDLFSKQLAELGDIYVNDAFGCVHRAHASTEGITKYLPSYAGCLLQKEITTLGNIFNSPEHPLVAIIGGSKVSTKIQVLENLLNRVDTLIIGGAMCFTFLKAQGIEVGKSLVEDEKIDVAKHFLEKAKESTTKVLLPKDYVIAKELAENVSTKEVNEDQIPADQMGLDVGSKTIEEILSVLNDAKTVVWNGPLGAFEIKPFDKATSAVAQCLAKSSAKTILGGGDTISAVNIEGVSEFMTHISTGGGASLEFLEGKQLPGITCLEKNKGA